MCLSSLLVCATVIAIGRGRPCGSLVRHQQGMYYYKPRPCDYRRADDAEEQLRARIQATFDALQAMGYDLQQVKWGFADEVAAQLHSNNARFWAFDRTAEAASLKPRCQYGSG
jgi:hypothetical protein